MAHRLLLCFRDDVSLTEFTDRRAELAHPLGKDVLDPISPGMVCVLRALSSDGAAEDDLAELVGDADGGIELATMYYRLAIWEKLGLLVHRLVADGRPIATVEPMIGARQFQLKEVARDDRFRLSRFAYCRRHNDTLIVESPLSVARTTLHDPVSTAVLLEIARPLTCLELTERVPGLTPELAQVLVGLLASAALVVAEGAVAALPEIEEDPATAQWSFHDLLFHSRSRSGGHDYPIGATYSFLDKIAPLPALKPAMSDDVIPLHRSDVDLLMAEDLPFTRVLESRRSIRRYGAAPISSDQLGEFLFRVGRVRGLIERDAERGIYYDATTRPYPSGGACYDLEIYVAVNKYTGLPPGICHYDPLHHRLSRLAGDNELVAALVRQAAVAGQIESEPQLLLVLASRFQRLSWKYSGIAYATTLKNVGALYQTMYLVATAMGLAPCALGAGNSLLFSTILGLDDLAEASVGEFILGSLPSD